MLVRSLWRNEKRENIYYTVPIDEEHEWDAVLKGPRTLRSGRQVEKHFTPKLVDRPLSPAVG